MSKYQETNTQNIQNLSISCHSVPDELLNKSVAKGYFQQFGKVLRIRLRPKHKTVVVEFANDESAQTAYEESGHFQGQDFVVSWTKPKANGNDKRKSRKKAEDPNWSDDPEIKDELEAMKGNFTLNKNYNLRPEAMVVDQPQTIPKKQTLALAKPTKTRQWKTDKPANKAHKPKNSEILSDQENDLLKTIMSNATTNEEKFRILDARDKLIRSRTVRQSELARAVRTIGTCPDMCPEKERLMREVQHQVASYEQLAGSLQKNTMNHKLAVKQYSRSSADQESPLAHELRPVEVLQLTMGYLLHRIMDLCENPETNLAEWYHFVWDRTRGIRKDVTQQELCCEKSVQLVEQCARFHVHCAARLVAEDVSVFDDKINTENLTKCLQTLKYMYHDLKVKQNISCKNEAEFRAYIVLLNLNDGNFMWEVQQLSEDIQRSDEIRFALSVYSALDKNNYVRFFKLIKSTSYLNACILLRYFNQVRFRALITIIRSYSPRLPYPVVDLCDMLAFEDVPSTIAFLEYHGLQLNVEQTHVLLDRNRFRQADTPFALDRAINIVETKRNTSVGEVVCGEPLPPKNYQTHVPHNSFDEKGYLKVTELPKDFQSKYQQFLKQFTEPQLQQSQELEDIPPEEPPKQKPFSFTNQSKLETNEKPDKQEIPKTVGGFVFELPTTKTTTVTTKLDTTVPKITTEEISEADGEIQSFFGSVKNDTRSQSPLFLIKDQSRSQSPLVFQQQQQQKSQEKNTFWGKSASTFTSNIFGNAPQIKPIVEPPKETPQPTETPETKTKNEDQELLELEEKQRILQQQLLEEEKLLKEKILQKHREKQEQELRAQKRLEQEQQALKKQIQKQKEIEISERRKQAELIYDTELSHQIRDVVDEVLNEIEEDLIKTRLQQIAENIKMRKFARRWKNLTRISKKKRKNFFDNPVWVSSRSVPQEADQLSSLSQDLTLHYIKRYKTGVSSTIPIKHKRNLEQLDIYKIVWKKLFEQLCSSKTMNFNIYWKIGFLIPENENEELLKQLEQCLNLNPIELMLLKQFKSNNGGSLNVCVKKLNENEFINGMIFFNFDHEISQTNRQTFNKIIHHNHIPFPIVVLNKSTFDETTIIQQLNLNEVISNYKILHYSEQNIDEILTEALEFLAENHIENPQKLEAHELKAVLHNCLGDELFHRLRSSMVLNTRFARLLQNPHNVINLYNEALKYLTKIIFKQSNYELPTFPEEFKQFLDNDVLLPCTSEYFPDYWKTPSYLVKLKKCVKSLHLPQLVKNWQPRNAQHFQQILYEYCREIFINEDPKYVVLKLLSVVYRDFNGSDLPEISWVDIFEIIVRHKIDSFKFTDKKHPLYSVVYDVEEMRDYRRVPWWFQLKFIHRGIKQIKYDEFEKEDEPITIIDDLNDEDIDLDVTLNNLYEKQTEDSNKIYNEYKELNTLLEDLEESMQIQKDIMKKFEEKAMATY